MKKVGSWKRPSSARRERNQEEESKGKDWVGWVGKRGEMMGSLEVEV
jgi:hypothetical protein